MCSRRWSTSPRASSASIRAELRRRNTIPAEAMPYKTALVYTYDCGDFGKNLDDCLEMADYEGFESAPRESAEARQAARASASPAPSKPRTPA